VGKRNLRPRRAPAPPAAGAGARGPPGADTAGRPRAEPAR